MRKCFIIDMYSQYVNGADKILHIMTEKAKTMKKDLSV